MLTTYHMAALQELEQQQRQALQEVEAPYRASSASDTVRQLEQLVEVRHSGAACLALGKASEALPSWESPHKGSSASGGAAL